MIVGIGIDIVDLDRFEKRRTPELVQELFLPDEIAYCASKHHPQQSFGARFAAKEAAFKALGQGLEHGLRFQHVEVLREDSGMVRLQFHGPAAARAAALNVTHSFVSLSHSRDRAIAAVVLENRQPASEE